METTRSQNSISIVDTLNHWYITQPLSNKPDDYKLCVIYLKGDTLIEDNQYLKVILSFLDPELEKHEYLGCIRENNSGDVKYIPPYYDSEYLLYPATMKIGDTIPVYSSIYSDSESYAYNIQQLYVGAVDSMYSCGAYHKRFFLHRVCAAGNQQVWIKDIGSTTGLVWNSVYSHCHSNPIHKSTIGLVNRQLIAFTHAKQVVFFNEKFNTVKTSILNK